MLLVKIIISIFLFQMCFGMEYDEEFKSGLHYFNYYQHKTIKQRTFKLKYQDKAYYEISNVNSILTIYRGNTQIGKLENDKENSFYFKYDLNYDYYIFFEFPDYESEFYAFYVTISDSPLNIITSSGLSLRYAKKRDFTLKIKNNESTPQVVAIHLHENKYGTVESVSFEENGNSFTPDYNGHDTYYAVIENEITFKTVIYYPYTQIFEYHSLVVYLDNTVNVLSENTTTCISPGHYDNIFYYRINPPLNKPYYELSFKDNSELYYVKDNFYKTKMTSIKRYTTNNFKFFKADTTNNGCCFSIIFMDEKNTISEESPFSISLFDSRSYELPLVNTKRYIYINFLKNDYFDASIYLVNFRRYVDYKYFHPKTNEYGYIFKNDLSQLTIEFKFTRKSTISDYYNFQIIYNGLNEDFKEETIKDDTFKCCNGITFFNLEYKPEKSYFYLLTNDTSNFYINFVKLSDIYSKNNFYYSNENTQIQLFPTEKKICFELSFEKNYGQFYIDVIYKRNFTVVSNNNFVFELQNLIFRHEYFIEIESEKDNIKFDYYIMSYKHNFNKFIYFTGLHRTQQFELPIEIKNKDMIDNLHFHFYDYEKIEENTFRCLNKTIYYNLTMNPERNYIYLFANETENIYINNKKLKNEDGINNFYDLNEDKKLNIYASEKNIICFELIYENKKGVFEMDKIQIRYFNVFSDNYFQFELINLILNMTYYIEIKNVDNNIKFDYFNINNKKYDFNEKNSFKAETEKAILSFPVSLKNKNLISNFSIYYYHIENINEDAFKCCNSNTFFNLEYKPEKQFIYLLTNDTSNFYINFVKLSEIDSKNNFYNANESTQIQIFPGEKKICFELMYETNKGKFYIDTVHKRNFTVFTNNRFIFSFINLVKNNDYFIEIKSEKDNIKFDYYILSYKFYGFKEFIYFKPTYNSEDFELPIEIKNKDIIDILHFHFYYYEKLKEDTFQCLNKAIYYNLTMNKEKKYIYLLTNKTEDIYINNKKLKNEDGINNFYDLNEDKKLNIYASEKNIICFELMYETKKGVFEMDKIQIRYFNILSDNYFKFDLIKLILNMTYYIEIKNKDNNLKFEYYLFKGKRYNFNGNISFKAETEKEELSFPVSLKNKNLISNFSIYYYHIEYINEDTFKCVNTVRYFNIKTNKEKDYIYLLTNGTSNLYLNDYDLISIKNDNNFYEIKKDTNLDVLTTDNNIICFELKFKKSSDYFELKSNDEITFNIFTKNELVFNLISLSQDIKYYIEVKTNNSNVIFDKYYFDGSYRYLDYKTISFKMSFKTKNNNIIFKLPVDIKSENAPDKLYIKFYSDKIEEDESKISPTAVKFASVLAYICFGLIIFPIIVLCGVCCINDDDYNGECNPCFINNLCACSEGGIDCKKFRAIYLCKKE